MKKFDIGWWVHEYSFYYALWRTRLHIFSLVSINYFIIIFANFSGKGRSCIRVKNGL